VSDTPWSVTGIGDLSDRTAIVTGANSGLGFETAHGLARHGAHVVLASRNRDKADRAAAQLRERTPDASLEVLLVDLADLASVASFADSFLERHEKLDLLVNNAGIMMVPKGVTTDGFERHMGTNHLGHFALTGRLMGALEAAPGARVVTVSSLAHRSVSLDLDDLMSDRGYQPMTAYGRSKLANLLFAFELQRRCEAKGLDVTSVAAHPGVSATELADHLLTNVFLQPLKLLAGLMLQGAEAGARPTLRAATDTDVRGGEYFGPAGMGEVRGRATRVRATAAARNETTAERLWGVSEDLTGVAYP